MLLVVLLIAAAFVADGAATALLTLLVFHNQRKCFVQVATVVSEESA